MRAFPATVTALSASAALFALGGCGSLAMQNASSVAPTHAIRPPLQAADADAKAILAPLGRIPGAVALSSAPKELAGFGPAADVIATGKPLALVAWYRVPVSAKSALAEATRLLPGWAQAPGPKDGWGTVSGIPMLSLIAQRDSAGTITRRTIEVYAFQMTPTSTAVEAQISENYRLDKTAVENFPTRGVLDVRVRSISTANTSARSFSVTDPAAIKHVAQILDSLPTMPVSDVVFCPALPGSATPRSEIQLTFRSAAGGPAVVVVTISQPVSGQPATALCGANAGVSVMVGKADQPSLDPTGRPVYAQVAEAVGDPGGS